jgi:hypothetical protein
LAKTDPAGGAGRLGGGESFERDTIRVDGLQPNANLRAAAVEKRGGVALAEAEHVDRVMGFLGREVAGSEIGLVEAVAGHGSALEKLAGLFEKGLAFRMRGFVAEFRELLEGLALGGGEVFGNLHADADMEVAPTPSGKGGDALTPQTKHLVRGCSGRDFQV